MTSDRILPGRETVGRKTCKPGSTSRSRPFEEKAPRRFPCRRTEDHAGGFSIYKTFPPRRANRRAKCCCRVCTPSQGGESSQRNCFSVSFVVSAGALVISIAGMARAAAVRLAAQDY